MIRKYLAVIVVIAVPFLLLCACGKSNYYYDCPTPVGVPTSSQMNDLKAYINSKSITATEDTRGFFYNISNPGYGVEPPTTASSVQVKYKGSLPDGTVFDSTETGKTAILSLAGTILGWQYGVPLIKKTGVIDLYLPPGLAYGCSASGKIPAGSMLIFHIELINY